MDGLAATCAQKGGKLISNPDDIQSACFNWCSPQSVTAFVKQLRALNITKLAEDEKKEYLDIVGRYEDILERLLMYIGNEKPKFEYLQVVVTQERPDIYETLCKEIDIETPTKIYADISDLQTLVRDRKQMLGSKRREQLFQLLVIGGTGICLVIASILNARFALNGPCNATSLIVPIVASAFAMFSGPNGFKMIFELILNGAEHAELNLIDSNLATLEKHLSDVREKCEELNQANKSFSYDLRFENFKVEGERMECTKEGK
ncbi:hypothetical protein BGZ96_004699, partial [Linnemannia gamsii]